MDGRSIWIPHNLPFILGILSSFFKSMRNVITRLSGPRVCDLGQALMHTKPGHSIKSHQRAVCLLQVETTSLPPNSQSYGEMLPETV